MCGILRDKDESKIFDDFSSCAKPALVHDSLGGLFDS